MQEREAEYVVMFRFGVNTHSLASLASDQVVWIECSTVCNCWSFHVGLTIQLVARDGLTFVIINYCNPPTKIAFWPECKKSRVWWRKQQKIDTSAKPRLIEHTAVNKSRTRWTSERKIERRHESKRESSFDFDLLAYRFNWILMIAPNRLSVFVMCARTWCVCFVSYPKDVLFG